MVAIQHCVIAGGNGQVGRLFAARLAEAGKAVTVVDLGSPQREATANESLSYETGDITAPGGSVARALGAADLVMLAVPEEVALAAVRPLAGLLGPETLLVDTLSVKSQMLALVQREMPGREVVSLNPMFAPSLDMAGRAIAVVTLAPGPRARLLLDLLTLWKGRLVYLGAAEHDRLAAALQVATHSALLAFGSALRNFEINIKDLCALAPPPHLTLLALLARIVSGVPEVYWDIQVGNPEASAARSALQEGLYALDSLAERQDRAGFEDFFQEMQTFLGSRQADLAALCRQIFEQTSLQAEQLAQDAP